MKRKSILFLLLMALMAPWAANAQTRETQTFDFENNAIPAGWTNDATYPWVVVSESQDSGHTGTYCIKSGNSGVSSSSSTISATFTFVSDGSISFLGGCWGEGSSSIWDHCIFSIDGTEKFNYGARDTRETYSFEVSAGEHTFTWSYTKDSSVNATGDAFFVDDIVVDLGIAGALPKPTNLACQLTEGNGTVATLSWTENGSATAWEIMLNNNESNLISATTNPWQLTGLTPEQTYTACVRATNGTNQSAWSNPVTFKPTNAYALTVNDGTITNGYVPIYGYYVDDITKSQFIIPADDLADMEGGTITKMTFFGTITGSSSNWGAAKFEVYMAETTETTLSALADYGTLDLVMNAASINIVNGEMVVEFDTPYQYMGGNLMIGFLQTVTGQYSSCSWTGVTAEGASMGGYGSYISQQNFLPKIKFAYLPGEAPSCPKPRNLTVSNVTSHTADLSWTAGGDETAWQICLNGDERNPIDVTTTTYTLTGLTAETTYYVKVRANCGSDDDSDWTNEISFPTDIACPAPTALEVVPTPISATVTWTGDASNYTLRYGTCAEPDPTQPATIIFHADDIWQDGSGYQMLLDADATAFGTIIPETGALSLNCSGNEDIYAEFEYKIPANADGECTTSNVVIDNTITLQIPAGTYDWCITNPTPGDRIWIASAQGNVGGRKDDYVFEAGMIYEFNMYMLGSNDATDVTIMCSNVDWTYVNNATSPYTIEGLDPETEYFVGVQAVCGGEDGESAWTSTNFTTPSNCDAPSNVNVPAETLMPTTAGVEWTGYQDGFEVWYRPAASGSVLLEDSFENGLSNWTTIDADGDGNNWNLMSEFGFNGTPHTGEDMVVSMSYNGNVLYPDNYLVSPQVALGGSITFWACAQDASYAAEKFGVAVSTTGNTDAADFTTIQSWTMTSKGVSTDMACKHKPVKATPTMASRSGNRTMGTWYQFTVDLSAYTGQTGYVALRHFDCSDMFYLDVDDITIYGPAGEEQEWMQATTDGTSIILGEDEALIPETTYECKVRGENRSCGDEGYTEFSETINFTTPGLCDNPNTFTFETLEATTATLNWIGYQESYNVLYRTAEVGVMLWEDFSNGASGWTASDLNEQSSIYTLGSGEDTWNAFGFVGDGTTQYLISPELESSDAIADSLYFYYYAYQGSTQTFKVGFSETYSLDGFTWGDEITTSSSDYYGYYEGVIPAGTKYFAIQSSGESSYLFVTDFYAVDYTNYVAPGEWVELTVNEPSVTMQPLTPNTVYDVYVQGICGEGEDDVTDWMGGYFTTPELTTLVQTIELAEGSNWISFYVETDLDALKAALEEVYAGTNMMIQGKNAYTTYNGSRWRGPLTSLDMSQMYMIEVAEVGRIVVEGEPLNPADLAITINEGANWIGFPFSTEMTVENAFAGAADQGDMIQGINSYATYNGTRWRGSLSALVPGQGYIYTSTTNKGDFYYPTNTSKAGQTTLQLKPFAKNRFEKKSFVPANIMPISK